MRRAGRKKKPLTIQPIKCVVMLSSDEEHDCIADIYKLEGDHVL